MLRVNSLIKQVLAEAIEDLKDPRLGMVTITGVDTQKNLRSAVVYFDTLNQEDVESALEGLKAAAPRLRHLLGNQVHLKYTPSLDFRHDSSVTGGEYIDELLRSISDNTEGRENEPD